MENRNIIIIMLVIIVILAAAIGFVLFNSVFAKDPSVVKITSDKKMNEGGDLSIKLTDLSDNPIDKEVVNVTITDKKGDVVVDNVVKTNANGKAKLKIDLKKGKYDVTVTFAGNSKYQGDNATQKLTIEEKEVEEAESSSSSSSSQPSAYAYKSDGTPMYSQAEVDQYMYNKYGSVNYHLQDNGYVNLDEPGFDDAGHWVGHY